MYQSSNFPNIFILEGFRETNSLHQLSRACPVIVRSHVFTLRGVLKLLSLTAFVAGITKFKIKLLKFNTRPKNNYSNRKIIIMHI